MIVALNIILAVIFFCLGYLSCCAVQALIDYRHYKKLEEKEQREAIKNLKEVIEKINKDS